MMLRVLLKFWFVDKFIWCVFCKCEYIERRMIEGVFYLIYYKRVAWAWAYCTVAGLDRAVARNQVLALPSCSWQLSVGHLLGLFFLLTVMFRGTWAYPHIVLPKSDITDVKVGGCSLKVHLAEVELLLKEFPDLVVAGFGPGSALSVCPPAKKSVEPVWREW